MTWAIHTKLSAKEYLNQFRRDMMTIKTVEFIGDRGQKIVINPAAVMGLEEWPDKSGGQTQLFLYNWGFVVAEDINTVKNKVFGPND